jgi:DNA-binding response OmpR family regulator
MLTKPRILIVEDDSNVRELIRTKLNMCGYDTQVARTGMEGLDCIMSFRPQGLVLDVNMPELDGFGVLEVLRKRGIRLPILMLTARHASDDVRRAVSLGAKDYLTKPFSEGQLQARVARLLLPPRPVAQAADVLID